MPKSRLILYLIFALIFLIFHSTGLLAGNLPYILNALFTFPVVLFSILILDNFYSGNSFAEVLSKIGFHRTSFKKILQGILISAALLMMYPLIVLVAGYRVFLNDPWLLNLCGLFLTGGLAEEMFFRGFLFRHLRESMSFKKAAVTSMLLFSAVHLVMFTYMDFYVSLFSTLLAVMISVPMSYLFEKADNTVWSPAIVHTVIRTVGLVVTVREENFMSFTLIWITGCMIIPMVITFFHRDFREMWRDPN